MAEPRPAKKKPGPPEDALSTAVDELNRRLSRSQRQLTSLTVVLGIAGGFVSSFGMLEKLDWDSLAVRIVVAVFLGGTLGTMALGTVVVRTVLSQQKRWWVAELSRKHAVDSAEVASFALPFGGPPARPRSGALWRRGALVAGAIVVLALGLTFVIGPEAAIRVTCVIAGALSTVAFWGYLGFRAPR
ncbi:MAG: hypothetical protein R3F14_02260 [Polyangiaceae bacterium]